MQVREEFILGSVPETERSETELDTNTCFKKVHNYVSHQMAGEDLFFFHKPWVLPPSLKSRLGAVH